MVENMKLITHLMLAYVPIKILNLVSITEFFSSGNTSFVGFQVGERETKKLICERC